MKKTYTLSHPKIKLARLFEATKHEIKKYVKRERNKPLPSGADYWDFDCKFGNTEATADVVHLSEINKHINTAEQNANNTFYVEIMAKPATRKNTLIDDE